MATVLIVDDSKSFRAALSAILVGTHVLVEAGDGRAALDVLAARADVDVVLLDMAMPVLDGAAFLAERARRPELARVPVIVVSSDHVGDVRGVARVFAKENLDPAALRYAVDEVIQGRGRT